MLSDHFWGVNSDFCAVFIISKIAPVILGKTPPKAMEFEGIVDIDIVIVIKSTRDINADLSLTLYVKKRTNRDISETAPINETHLRKQYQYKRPPKTSATTIGHSKVFFWPLLHIKRLFYSGCSNGPIFKCCVEAQLNEIQNISLKESSKILFSWNRLILAMFIIYQESTIFNYQ